MTTYEDAVRQAARRAYKENQCFTIYRIGDKFFVRNSKEELPPTPDVSQGKIINLVKTICVAQRWDDQTVQLRFDGAYSEWIKL